MDALPKRRILCFQLVLVFWMSRSQLMFYWLSCAVSWSKDPSCTSFTATTCSQEWSLATGHAIQSNWCLQWAELTHSPADQSWPNDLHDGHNHVVMVPLITCDNFVIFSVLPPQAKHTKYTLKAGSWPLHKTPAATKCVWGGATLEQRGGSSNLDPHICICLSFSDSTNHRKKKHLHKTWYFSFFKTYESILGMGYSHFAAASP